MKHKYYNFIIAWAEGEKIQAQCASGEWVDLDCPDWRAGAMTLRIKPKEPEKRILYIYNNIPEGKTYMSATKFHSIHENPSSIYMGEIEVDYDI